MNLIFFKWESWNDVFASFRDAFVEYQKKEREASW